ncbi:metal-dependent transcriptional regulator [Halorubrum trapanicum]|uniref:metal-dependent transcriptional regulator n=1 Tax=Halorubrum trapanicum TaxID=29284 RepID=UPI001AE79218|nr:metal-dependent transcriptional regulator [Halorubrum trapanicum]
MAATTSPAPRCRCRRPHARVDRDRARYLAAIDRLAADPDDRVRTGAVSDRLGVSPASVTEMFGRLDAAGLVDHEKRAGARLTERGERIAAELAWRRCVVRTFFSAELDFGLPEGTGFRIGFALPREGVERLSAITDASPGDPCRSSGDAAAGCPWASGD